MSITLFCLVKGNKSANAFSVKISRNEPISELKEAIKTKKPQTFANVDANNIKLWKVPISNDHDQLRNLSLEDSDELLAINDIGDYWPTSPPKKHIHVLVSPPESTAISDEVLKLREQLVSLQTLFNKSTHEFEVVVHPKQKANKWTTNIKKASLVGLKDYIRKMYQPPALENDGTELNLMNDRKKYFPYNDQDLHEMLCIFVSKNNLKFTVFIETPSKAFLDWSFPKYKDLEEDSSRAILKHLIAELEARLKSIPINGNEASKSQYVCFYLVSGVNLYEGKFELRLEKNITGPNGHGPVDFAIDLLRTMKMVGVKEVKDEDIFKGIAQNAVQLESALSNRKRKVSKMEEDSLFVSKTFGIITDAKEWYFMECSLDDQDKLAFRLSKPVTVIYDSKNMGENVERVLGHIA
ncbi:11231_t:CDS:2 [Dentiscutata heterogama]|uniref:11231_t:CDS:1 n=1 Tax=Dentiscutata heterogama TaxID=1316150 RepID=A0ACA9MC92_9GLOM|nr:11231_t:CDS:2 [Dentiscutata heterogama]